MNSIQNLIGKKPNNLLSVYFTPGYPKLNDTLAILENLSKGGVDFIEVGMPYSDPMADGPTIQESSGKAIQNGMNLDVLFEQLTTIKGTNTTPLVLMGYLNQMIKYGEEKFLEQCVHCNIDTVIIPDMPMIEYKNHYQKLFSNYGISNVFLITPQTSEERIYQIDALTEAFIYVVASASITGAKNKISDQQIKYFENIQSLQLKSPLMVGFGISNKQTFETACKYANGAIVGSAFIKAVGNKGQLEENIIEFLKAIKN